MVVCVDEGQCKAIAGSLRVQNLDCLLETGISLDSCYNSIFVGLLHSSFNRVKTSREGSMH